MVAFGQGVFGLGVFGIGAEGRRIKLTGVLTHSISTGALDRPVGRAAAGLSLNGAGVTRRSSGGRLRRGMGIS